MTDPQIEQVLAENSALKHQLARQQGSQQILLATQERLCRLLSSSPTVIYSSQPSCDYGIIFVSASIEQFGYQPQDFLEHLGFWRQCLHPEDVTSVLKELSFLIQEEQRVFEYRFLHKNGAYRWIQDQRRLIRDDHGVPVEMIGSWQDITDRKQMEQALFHKKELADNVLRSMGDGVITTDAAGCIQYLNPIAEQVTGWCLEHAKGVPFSDVFKMVQAISLKTIASVFAKVRSSGKAVGLPHASVLIARDGAEYAIDGTAAPVRDCSNQIIGTVVVFRDVTQHYALARRLSWQASHDFLTGLVNRREFEQRLAEAIATAQEVGQQHTLCYLDLDQFKIVNDTCGHVAGDDLLRQLSVLLRQRLRTSDTLARIGGDEFGIILHDCGPINANSITNHLLKMIQDFRFVWQNNTFSIGASIGLVSINAASRDLNAILGAADAACYAAKERGRNRIQVYQADDVDLVQQRGERQWIARITKALEEDRFCLYKQPIVPIAHFSQDRMHYELLLRMVTETGEVISPMAFIPAAERYGLMTAIDRWVVSYFFSGFERNHSAMATSSHLDCIYTINLSGMSINDEQFLGFLKDQFRAYDISPPNICFEITETAAIANLSKAARLIEEIKGLGCSFALDDFGSGMSSFAYLKNLPVDYLKIDGSFIKNMISDAVDSALVEGMNRIGHEIGMQTIAEFVENDSILEKLRGFGVDFAQGYGIARPSPLILNLLSPL